MTAPIALPRRCSIGGTTHIEHGGSARYEPPCPAPPTHRYRAASNVEGHWSYRCTQHAAWLDRSRCTVEPLTGGEAE